MRLSPIAFARSTALRAILSSSIAVLMFLTATVPLQARVNHKPGYNSFSPEQDIELGRDAAKDAEKELKIGRAHV